jgi:hypothetical protein
MERIVAVKKLGNILGKRMGYRIDLKAPSPEERQLAKEARPTAAKLVEELFEKKKNRMAVLLAADIEYQTIKTELETARTNLSELNSKWHRYKITVGLSDHMFFHVKAEGDSWEEVIAKLS